MSQTELVVTLSECGKRGLESKVINTIVDVFYYRELYTLASGVSRQELEETVKDVFQNKLIPHLSFAKIDPINGDVLAASIVHLHEYPSSDKGAFSMLCLFEKQLEYLSDPKTNSDPTLHNLAQQVLTKVILVISLY
jgi:hypothetical protein